MMRIRGDHPFLGTLALFAEIRVTHETETAATDGRALWFNPRFVDKQSSNQLCGLFIHELLHAALQHVLRRRERDSKLWNIAADIVVNGMIRRDTAYDLPDGGVEESSLALLCVEEIYEQLVTGKREVPMIKLLDLLPELNGGHGVAGHDVLTGSGEGSLDLSRSAQMERHWRAALQQAGAVARRINRGFGKHGLNGLREFETATSPTLGWRDLLWQFMVATPYDFAGYDRRFIHRKMYLEDLIGESVEVAICIDTSGSIGERELGAFMSEVQGILHSYPQIRARCSLLTQTYTVHTNSIWLPTCPRPRGAGVRHLYRTSTGFTSKS